MAAKKTKEKIIKAILKNVISQPIWGMAAIKYETLLFKLFKSKLIKLGSIQFIFYNFSNNWPNSKIVFSSKGFPMI